MYTYIYIYNIYIYILLGPRLVFSFIFVSQDAVKVGYIVWQLCCRGHNCSILIVQRCYAEVAGRFCPRPHIEDWRAIEWATRCVKCSQHKNIATIGALFPNMFRTVHISYFWKRLEKYIVIILLCMTICLKLENHEAGKLQIRPDSLSFQRWVSRGPDWSKGDLQASPVAKRHKCQRVHTSSLGMKSHALTMIHQVLSLSSNHRMASLAAFRVRCSASICSRRV
jgi:hypothetical protein